MGNERKMWVDEDTANCFRMLNKAFMNSIDKLPSFIRRCLHYDCQFRTDGPYDYVRGTFYFRLRCDDITVIEIIRKCFQDDGLILEVNDTEMGGDFQTVTCKVNGYICISEEKWGKIMSDELNEDNCFVLTKKGHQGFNLPGRILKICGELKPNSSHEYSVVVRIGDAIIHEKALIKSCTTLKQLMSDEQVQLDAQLTCLVTFHSYAQMKLVGFTTTTANAKIFKNLFEDNMPVGKTENKNREE